MQIIAKYDLKNASFYNNNTAKNENTVIHPSVSVKMYTAALVGVMAALFAFHYVDVYEQLKKTKWRANW